MVNKIYKKGNIFCRFEPSIDEGTLFIFNKDNGEIYEGDRDSWSIFKLIDGCKDTAAIVNDITEEFDIQTSSEIEQVILATLDDFRKSGLIFEVN